MGIVTCDIGISIDGFAAGPDQTAKDPLGTGAENLHRWMFEEPDENAAEIEAIVQAGAFIMGRNMYAGPGEWDESWTGWWGDDPPYHAPVFVLTHQARDDVPMQGGTTFSFVTEGIEAALERARDAAGDDDVAIAGGASTVDQFLEAGLIDELRLHTAPMVLGAGERLFAGVTRFDLEPAGSRHNDLVIHQVYRRRA